ncbi:hypothetical protein [Bosea sp. (in: a-proteobacteria)]|uniref:hypothetical protein n=1 Tax=Bosea sp. (in: a-proteobacteria) TaxID=1871050 RepID=UPI00262BC994|nr:hypothetical protein [Bosea sp. (in: a-proteobacteria)]MCO5092132.1 flagellar protein FlaG [Bosea sp. (in: a-proteobacteria)]
MDFGNAPRIAAATSAPPVTRADVTAQAGGVGVDLPPEQTVQSAPAGAAVNVDVRAQDRQAQDRAAEAQRARADQEQPEQTIERKLTIDRETRAVVFQKKDQQTGETISQLPDETLLKLRAYSRELTERAREAEQTRHQVEETA